ncbi:unnamed protein product [Closterium sp. Naga37s-1]|nr:unnamed protein product [Closterium sp. Naga37s-1]
MSSSLEWRMRKQQSKLGLPVDEPEQQQEKLGWPLVKPEQQHRELGWPIDKPEQEQGGLGWSVDKWVEEQGQRRPQHHTADASSSFFHVGSTANLVSNGVIRVDSSRVEIHVELAGDERAAAKEDGAELERAAAVRWRAERQLMIALRAAAAGGWVGALERPRAVGNASVSGSAQQSLGQPRVAGNVGANVAGNVARNLRATALRSRKLAAAKLPSQKGFVSIDCGYMGSAGASNLGLKWLPDTAAPGGSVAVITRVPDELVGQVTVEQTLRVFDDGKPSNCYQIPLVAPGRYLVRLTFWYGNYDGKNMPPVFNVTVGTVSLGQYTPSNDQILVLEVIVTVPARTMAICLVRVSADPIINAIEVRPLPAGAYNASDYSEQVLLNYWRLTCAGDSFFVGSYRYPDDPLDRVWYADMPLFGDPTPGTYTYIPSAASVAVANTNVAIPASMSSNAVPQFVVQKARTTKSPQGLTYRFYGLAPGKYQAYLYFTDIIPPTPTAKVTTNTSAPSADLLLAILINGAPLLRNAPALPSAANRQWNKNTAGQLSFAFDVVGAAGGAGGNATASAQGAGQGGGQGNGQGNGQQQGPLGTVAETSIQLKAEEGSRVKEVGLAGLELYTVVEPKAAVPKEQVRALSCIKAQMGGAAALDGWTGGATLTALDGWTGDPCYPIVWPGVTCKTSRLHSSVIGLNLTHLNISGPFSACISELTTLQTLWMDHNRLQGSIPSSIGNLTQLRSIKLNNNKLSGPVPASLAALPNLQFLDLSSNNLSGPLPFNSSSDVQIGVSGNLNLCSPDASFGLPPCNNTIPTPFSSPSDTSAQTATSPAAMSTAVLMALILGVIIGVLMVLLASWLLLRWQQRAAERGGMGGRSGAGGGGGGDGMGGDGLGQQPPVVVYVHGDTGAVTVQAADSAGATLYTQSNQDLLSPKAAAGLAPAAVTAAAAAKTAALEATDSPASKAAGLPAFPASQEETPLLAPAPDKPPSAAAAAVSAEAAVPAAPTEGMVVPGAGNAVGPAAFAAGAAALATGAVAAATARSPARGKAASTPVASPAVAQGLAVRGAASAGPLAAAGADAAAGAPATDATDASGISATPVAATAAVATAAAATTAAAARADHSMAYLVAPGSSARRFALATLSTATNHFSPSEIIGSGGFGPVYRGVLPDGRMVAVKRRDDDSLQGDREFVNEVDLLSRACHPNLVELVGYCREARQHLLVYEFMPNGTVREHLYDQMGQPLGRLRWLTRIQIALGAGRAIQYLHTCLQPPIIHRDIKTSNILLDGRLNARVADFGLSRVGPQDNRSHVSTVVKGTAGYLDPEYFTIQQLTDRSDVFSFGVVLLELISGQQPIDLNRPQQHWSIIDWARDHLQQGNIRAVADPTVNAFLDPPALTCTFSPLPIPGARPLAAGQHPGSGRPHPPPARVGRRSHVAGGGGRHGVCRAQVTQPPSDHRGGG